MGFYNKGGTYEGGGEILPSLYERVHHTGNGTVFRIEVPCTAADKVYTVTIPTGIPNARFDGCITLNQTGGVGATSTWVIKDGPFQCWTYPAVQEYTIATVPLVGLLSSDANGNVTFNVSVALRPYISTNQTMIFIIWKVD